MTPGPANRKSTNSPAVLPSSILDPPSSLSPLSRSVRAGDADFGFEIERRVGRLKVFPAFLAEPAVEKCF